MRCPICGGSARRAFEKHGYGICDCESCGHRFCDLTPPENHVENVYGDGYFNQGGAGYPDYIGEAKMLTAHGSRYGRLLSRYMQPGSVLDVGSAAGFILKGLQESGWQGQGIEPNAHMAAYARSTVGVDVQAGTLERLETDQQVDLVTMIQVIAHFNDLCRALQRAAAVTRSGGYWLVETWDKDSLPARLLGENWHEYSPPSVLHWFSPATLRRLTERFGFIEVARGRPQKWLNGAHAKSLMRYKLETSLPGRLGMCLLDVVPDDLPIPYPTFDIFWALYRKA